MFDHLVGNELDLAITVTAIIVAAALAIWARVQSKKPVQVGKVRWINYSMVMMVCAFVILMGAAHLYTLLTGNQLEPRRRRGM